MARTTDTNLNDHIITPFTVSGLYRQDWRGLCLCQNFGFEEFLYRVRGYGKEIVANGNANTVLALTKAERACNFNFFFEIVIRDQGADGFNNLTGAFQVARASDTYSNSEFHKNNPFVNDRM
jgi:hypothetical protein